jgi:hypothetical protein
VQCNDCTAIKPAFQIDWLKNRGREGGADRGRARQTDRLGVELLHELCCDSAASRVDSQLHGVDLLVDVLHKLPDRGEESQGEDRAREGNMTSRNKEKRRLLDVSL